MHDLLRDSLESYPLGHTECFLFYHRKIKFSAQKSRKTGDFEKNQYPNFGFRNMAKIASMPKLLEF